MLKEWTRALPVVDACGVNGGNASRGLDKSNAGGNGMGDDWGDAGIRV